MATDLVGGSVPSLYREVYDIVCPNQEHVDQDMFLKLLVKSSLPSHTLSQIWEAVDNKQGFLSRAGLYKALALTALAQQGKSINEKILEKFSDTELPKPNLGDLSDLKQLSIKVRREKTPNLLGLRFQELLELDTIKVELVPEKKGLILKHIEYEVTSQRYRTTVLRRYNDFMAFQEVLLFRYPYRMIPKLPPKKIMGDRQFIELRRRALRRFLNLVARHPVLYDDGIVKYFFNFNGSDMQHKIKEHFRGVPDEFMTSEIALKAKALVPMDTQLQLANSREHIKALINGVYQIKNITERMVQKHTDYASDMLQLGRQLGSLAADTAPVSVWASGSNDTWAHLKQGFKHMSVEYASLADKSRTAAMREDRGLVEDLNIFMDMLLSHKDLCDRIEKGVTHDHQRALQKLGQYKKKHMSATFQGNEHNAVEQLEQRILLQESEISNMENRNYFSLHCVQMETQLIHANLENLYTALNAMANEEARAHSELGAVWEQMKPIISRILPPDHTNGSTSPTSSRTSPLNFPSTEQPGISV